MGKVIVHACGGAGINITDKVIHSMAKLGDGFATPIFHYIDTSRANISKVSPLGEFWKVEGESFGGSTIVGSGGERSTHAKEIVKEVPHYLDKYKYTKKVSGEYHLVVFSASGGSGTVIGTTIINNLMQRGIPLLAVCIGGSENSVTNANTMKTLSTMDAMAKKANKHLSVMYVNNQAMDVNGQNAKEHAVNQILLTKLTALLMFLSGKNESIDEEDMSIFLTQDYKTFELPTGIYGLDIFSIDIKVDSPKVPTVMRTLTRKGVDYNNDVTCLHSKQGFITDEECLAMYGDDTPIHAVLFAKWFENEFRALMEIDANYKEIAAKISSSDLVAGDVDDETGMVL